MIQRTVNSIVSLFVKKNLINEDDKTFYTNMVLGRMDLEFIDNQLDDSEDSAILFNRLGDYAQDKLKLNKDRFIDEVSGFLLPAPSKIDKTFKAFDNKEEAFTDFFNKSKDSYYVKYDRLEKNIEWEVQSDFGKVDITINLSKPEKTREEIDAALKQKAVAYPKCVLCKENIGFFGNATRASRQNIRFIYDELNNKKVFMHFSPYGYYNQHLIVNNWEHEPLIISEGTIKTLLDFVNKYPFYFLGSNADLSIVGGSILSHQHYQGGAGTFPLFESKVLDSFKEGNVEVQMLQWPLSTIKLVGKSSEEVFKASAKALNAWTSYENKDLQIIASKDGARQNGITPIARKVKDNFEVYLILRNNGTSEESPEGIFHVAKDVWNIKKESIGLIEAAGKAILPGRLLHELDEVAKALESNEEHLSKEVSIHEQWFQELKKLEVKGSYIDFVKNQAALKFAKGLKDCGVFYGHQDVFKTFVKGVFND